METYPAQINSDTVSIDGYEDFEITVKRIKEYRKKKILNNKRIISG